MCDDCYDEVVTDYYSLLDDLKLIQAWIRHDTPSSTVRDQITLLFEKYR